MEFLAFIVSLLMLYFYIMLFQIIAALFALL
jgi:hypothetical protein